MPKKSKEITIGENCDIRDHRPCDVKVAVSLASESAKRYDLAIYPQLKAIQDRGTVTTAEAKRVLKTWDKQLQASAAPANQKTWGKVVLENL